MITEVFENLFKPVSDDEYSERRKDLYPLIRKFEEEIRQDNRTYDGDPHSDTSLVPDFFDFYHEYSGYYSDADVTIDWYAIFLYLKYDQELDDTPDEKALMDSYMQWKEQND